MAPEDAPATRRDIKELADRLSAMDGRLSAMDGRLSAMDGRLSAMDGHLMERMRDMQTELLRAFGPWQDQIRFQFRELEVNTGNTIHAVKERMNVLERRLLEIERKLLLDPPAA